MGYRYSDKSGLIYHYNGVDWYEYPEPRNLPRSLYDIWTDGREVFVVGWITHDYPQVSIVIHGR